MRRIQWFGFLALLAAGCGGQISGSAIDGVVPADPGITYEEEPDNWAQVAATLDEPLPPYGIESCRLQSGIAYGNYTRLTPYQVASLAHSRGVACGANLVRAVAITGAESSRYQYAYLINTNCSIDRGLWQINSGYWPAYSKYDLATNSRGMYVISNHGTNWHPWVTYNNGAYRAYWNNACAAVKALCGARNAGC